MLAVLLTGQYRTFDRTWQLIHKHLLQPNDARVFVFAEHSDPEAARAAIVDRWRDHVGSCTVLPSTRTEDYHHILVHLLKSKPAIQAEAMHKAGFNQNYLVSSGSVLEYYQFLRAYDQMLAYERQHDVKFTVVVRSRLDVVFTVPLELRSFFSTNHAETTEAEFTSLGVPLVAERQHAWIYRNQIRNPPSTRRLQERDVVWTFRKNVVWIGRREVMDRLYPLLYWYGTYVTDSPYSFNSETQFNEFCFAHNITTVDFHTAVEERYLVSREANTTLLSGSQLSETRDRDLVVTVVRPLDYHFDRL